MTTTREVRSTLARLGGQLIFTPSVADPDVPWQHPTPGMHAGVRHGAVMMRDGLAVRQVCSLAWADGWTATDERGHRLLALVMADRLEALDGI